MRVRVRIRRLSVDAGAAGRVDQVRDAVRRALGERLAGQAPTLPGEALRAASGAAATRVEAALSRATKGAR